MRPCRIKQQLYKCNYGLVLHSLSRAYGQVASCDTCSCVAGHYPVSEHRFPLGDFTRRLASLLTSDWLCTSWYSAHSQLPRELHETLPCIFVLFLLLAASSRCERQGDGTAEWSAPLRCGVYNATCHLRVVGQAVLGILVRQRSQLCGCGEAMCRLRGRRARRGVVAPTDESWLACSCRKPEMRVCRTECGHTPSTSRKLFHNAST